MWHFININVWTKEHQINCGGPVFGHQQSRLIYLYNSNDTWLMEERRQSYFPYKRSTTTHRSHMCTYCSYKKKKMFQSSLAINKAPVHCSSCTSDMVQADGLHKTRQYHPISPIPPRDFWEHDTQKDSLPYHQGLGTLGSCCLWTVGALQMTSAGMCRWNMSWATYMRPRRWKTGRTVSAHFKIAPMMFPTNRTEISPEYSTYFMVIGYAVIFGMTKKPWILDF